MGNQLRPHVRLITVEEVKKTPSLKEKVDEIIIGNEEDFPGLLKGWDTHPNVQLYVIWDEDGAKPVGLIGWSADVADPK